MVRTKIATRYSSDFLETERPQPLVDNKIEQIIQDVLNGKLDKDISDTVYSSFKGEMTNWLLSSKLNQLSGLHNFDRLDIINGCTQFIDNQYIKGSPQFVSGDYRYHDRLGNTATLIGNLDGSRDLIIAMPFPSTGNIHKEMNDILDECLDKQIPVHIDGAWISCCRDIVFDFSHPAIESVGISLSKGLGLGWNRVGLRWTKKLTPDSVSIMNDFNMNLRAPVMIGLHFLKNFEPDYLWNTHGRRYIKVCNDFNLETTNSIYLALKDGQPVGVSPLIRYLENADA